MRLPYTLGSIQIRPLASGLFGKEEAFILILLAASERRGNLWGFDEKVLGNIYQNTIEMKFKGIVDLEVLEISLALTSF